MNQSSTLLFTAISGLLLLLLSGCQVQENPEGQRLYEAKCLNCHQENGQGVGALIPPLTDEAFLNSHREKLACIILYGMKGPVSIQDKSYSDAMPGVENIKEADLVNILNYVGKNFGNNVKEFTLEEVKENLDNCNGQYEVKKL